MYVPFEHLISNETLGKYYFNINLYLFISLFLAGLSTLIPSLAYLYIGLPLCLRAE